MTSKIVRMQYHYAAMNPLQDLNLAFSGRDLFDFRLILSATRRALSRTSLCRKLSNKAILESEL